MFPKQSFCWKLENLYLYYEDMGVVYVYEEFGYGLRLDVVGCLVDVVWRVQKQYEVYKMGLD